MTDEIVVQATPLNLQPAIEAAAALGKEGVEVVERLHAIKIREREDAARAAYNAALSQFMAECPHIVKNKDTAKLGAAGTKYGFKFADLPQIKRAIDPVLSKLGLSYGFKTTRTEIGIRVVCLLRHKDGHVEEAGEFEGPIDSGSMNAIQRVGSGRSYARRYALEDALGLCSSDDDDGWATGEDANVDEGETITPEQLDALDAKATEVGADWDRFKRYLGVDDLRTLPASRFDAAMAALKKKAKK